MERKAVKVFVPPVGADMRMFFLSHIAGTPYLWVIENSLNFEKNHSFTNS